MIVHVDPVSSCLVLCGEVSLDGTEVEINPEAEKIVVWQSPTELRSCLRLDLMSQVLSEMLESTASWSMTTGVRALLFSADVKKSRQSKKCLRNIQSSWNSAPICTSIAVVFWQKYLCKFARAMAADSETTLEFILRWMPLKGDCTLPGQLSHTMQKCGWHCLNQCQAPASRGNSGRALRDCSGSLRGPAVRGPGRGLRAPCGNGCMESDTFTV